jgi:DNA polymerase I-like protein with 3'-5' exonuclease and polymerase domains
MAYIIPCLHPAHLARGAPVTELITRDLHKAVRVSQQGPTNRENLVVAHPAVPPSIEACVRTAAAWLERWYHLRCPVAVDVETSSVDFMACKLWSISLAGCDGHDTAIAYTLRDMRTLPPEAQAVLDRWVAAILEHPEISKVYHNAPFDYAVLRQKHFKIEGPLWDTLALHHLHQPDIPHDLGGVGHTYLDVEPWKLDHDGQKQAYTHDLLELLFYNAKDALNTAKLYQILKGELEPWCSAELQQYQMAAAQLAASMETYGIPVNMELRARRAAEIQAKLDDGLAWLRHYLNWPDFNPDAHTHVSRALYSNPNPAHNFVGLTPTAFTDTGLPSTSYKDIIDHLEHPWVRRFVDWKEARTTWSTIYKDKSYDEDGNPLGKAGALARAIYADSRAHIKWNPCGQKGSRWSSSPNCYDAETEVLTQRGWVAWPDVESTDFLGQIDEGGICSLVKPEALQSFEAPKYLVHFHNRTVDHLVTLEHRERVQVQRLRNGRYIPTEEETLAGALACSIPKGAAFAQTARGYATGTERVHPARIAVLCACQADGWRRAYGKGEAWAFYLTKKRKVKRLTKALEVLGTAASWYATPLNRKADGRKPQVAIYLRDCELKTWIDARLGASKEFGPWLLQWDEKSLRAFAREATQWDGRSARTSEYSSTSQACADWVQIAGVLSGTQTGHVRAWRGSQSKKDCYTVSQGQRDGRAGVRATRPKTVASRAGQRVYCATVPSGWLLTRRNGKVLVSGNSQNIQKGDGSWDQNHRIIFEAPEGRVIIGADKDQLELRLMACRAGVRELLEEMRKPDADPHTLAAANVYGDNFFQKPKQERKDLRNGVKNVVYASIYMAGWHTVWRTVRGKKFIPPRLRALLTKQNVRHIHTSYFGQYVEIPAYHKANEALVMNQGYIEIPPFGRRRPFPLLPPPMTELANWPIQTEGSDHVLREMVLIQDELNRRTKGDAHIIIHGHDAIYIECSTMHAEWVKQTVDRIFGCTRIEGPAGYVDLTAEADIGKHVGEVG